MKSDSSMWCRGGDLGNGFQMGGVLLACHILLGIDDFDVNTLEADSSFAYRLDQGQHS